MGPSIIATSGYGNGHWLMAIALADQCHPTFGSLGQRRERYLMI